MHKNVHWLAGLLEGEGSFIFSNGSPRICIGTVDLDIANRVHSAMSCTSNISEERTVTCKPFYKVNLQGVAAIDLMKELHPLLSSRRQEKISQVIEQYNKYRNSTNHKNHRDNIRVVDGKKICLEHGPVDMSNILYVGKYTRCKGCYTR